MKSKPKKLPTIDHLDFDLELIKIRSKEPEELFDNVQTDFYDRLHELEGTELEELKKLFILNNWLQYLPNIQKTINEKK